jgi:hypothetical protein
MQQPDDRLKEQPDEERDIEPKIYAIIDGKKFPRPGLETFFASPRTDQPGLSTCSCHPVVGTYCSCNKVAVCSCVGHTSSGGRSGCRCAPVH